MAKPAQESYEAARRTVLVVSPHFPPANTPDMQRVRISLPYFSEFGWRPLVLAVRPDQVEAPLDPLLQKTLPEGLEVWRERAVPLRWARRLGIGNLGLRSFWWLYRRGCSLIQEHGVDLVYFSSTVFTAFPLGRLWKRRYGTPCVIDMQDPWVVEYSGVAQAETNRRSLKSHLARLLHRRLEPWTMRDVDALVSVSEDYVKTLKRRYHWLDKTPAITLPFGCSERDFEILETHPQPNRFFRAGETGLFHGVYVGRGGSDMRPALEAIFGALRAGLKEAPDLFEPLRLHFVGTDYAPPPRGRFSVKPVADQFGVGDRVQESPARVPYFEALQLLKDSDFLLVPGSDDPQYTASKIYPYVLARKPLLCVFHERSSVVDFVKRMECGPVVSFQNGLPLKDRAGPVLEAWRVVLEQIGAEPFTRWEELGRFSAPEMARQQCQLFDKVLAQSI